MEPQIIKLILELNSLVKCMRWSGSPVSGVDDPFFCNAGGNVQQPPVGEDVRPRQCFYAEVHRLNYHSRALQSRNSSLVHRTRQRQDPGTIHVAAQNTHLVPTANRLAPMSVEDCRRGSFVARVGCCGLEPIDCVRQDHRFGDVEFTLPVILPSSELSQALSESRQFL